MGVFDDKKFEELDWISQATEPIDSELNEILGLIPEEIVIDFATYHYIVMGSYGLDLTVDQCINYAIRKYCTNKSLTWEQKDAIRPCFEFQMDGSVDLDFEKEVITGSLKFVKTQATMDEKVLEGMLGREGIAEFSRVYINGAGLGRANEIMELLTDCEAGMKTRSFSKKRSVIHKRLITLFKNNEWKIKDTELANKVGKWIAAYIQEGDIAALSNFCRLKVMTHKDQPIYSMEEVK